MKHLNFSQAICPDPTYDGLLVRFYFNEISDESPAWFDVAIGQILLSRYDTPEGKDKLTKSMFYSLIEIIKSNWEMYQELPATDLVITSDHGLKIHFDNQLDWKNYVLTLQ